VVARQVAAGRLVSMRRSSAERRSGSLPRAAFRVALAVVGAVACGKTVLDQEGETDASGDVRGGDGKSDARCQEDCTTDASYDGPVVADGTCPNGLFTLVADAGAVTGLALDDASVYWTTFEAPDAADADPGGSVLSVPKCGGTPTTLTRTQSLPVLPALDSTHVYWPNTGNGTVARVAKTGGVPETLASNQLEPSYLATDGEYVYWTNHAGNLLNHPLSSLVRVPASGGDVMTLSSHQTHLGAVAVVGSSVFFGADTSLEVVPAGGGVVRPIAPVGLATTVAVDSVNVFCLSDYTPDLFRVAIDGGALSTLASVPSNSGPASGIVIDATSVYWAEGSSGQILRVSKDGGPVSTLASGQPVFTGGVIGDGSRLYWNSANSIRGLTLE
jgi:hypothetical protein